MTRHLPREKRIKEILDAAENEIIKHGYSKLTMEAIALRTSLSKGGVYRFFKNKKDVALAVHDRIFQNWLNVNDQKILQKNVSLVDSITQLITEPFYQKGRFARWQKVWIHLYPEVIRDKDFRQQQDKNIEVAKQRYLKIVNQILEREGDVNDIGSLNKKIHEAISVVTIFMDGVMMHAFAGEPVEYLKGHIRTLIQAMVTDNLRG